MQIRACPRSRRARRRRASRPCRWPGRVRRWGRRPSKWRCATERIRTPPAPPTRSGSTSGSTSPPTVPRISLWLEAIRRFWSRPRATRIRDATSSRRRRRTSPNPTGVYRFPPLVTSAWKSAKKETQMVWTPLWLFFRTVFFNLVFKSRNPEKNGETCFLWNTVSKTTTWNQKNDTLCTGSTRIAVLFWPQ